MWIPADRFLSILDRCGIENEDLDSSGVRRIFELRRGSQDFIGLDAADRILTSVNLTHWFHRPAEHGGLADIYEDGKQYGSPNTTKRYPKTKDELILERRLRERAKKRRQLERDPEGMRARWRAQKLKQRQAKGRAA